MLLFEIQQQFNRYFLAVLCHDIYLQIKKEKTFLRVFLIALKIVRVRVERIRNRKNIQKKKSKSNLKKFNLVDFQNKMPLRTLDTTTQIYFV